ncbi:hypothetical protein DB346_09460 [Verrucomicrobia bacterium LW23]|nr:hypothetical protein DB346_09460 [Verrucomicrobia bacterium LW23]
MSQRLIRNIAFVALCVLVVATIPISLDHSDYRWVMREEDWKGSGNLILSTRSSELFFIRHGRLYLKCASRAPSATVQWRWTYQWTPARLQALEQEHPELKSMWPDPAAEYRGIWWLDGKK